MGFNGPLTRRRCRLEAFVAQGCTEFVQDHVGVVAVAPVSKLCDALLQIDLFRDFVFLLSNTFDSHTYLGLGVILFVVLETKSQFP